MKRPAPLPNQMCTTHTEKTLANTSPMIVERYFFFFPFFFELLPQKRQKLHLRKMWRGGTFISVNIFSHPARCLGDVAAFFIPAPQLLFRPTVSSAREEQRHLSFLPIGTRPFPKSSRGRGRKRRKKENVVGLSLVGRMQHPSRSFRYGGYTERHRRDRAGCRYV